MRKRQYRLVRPVINGKRSETWYAAWREGGRTRRASTGLRNEQDALEWLERANIAETEVQGVRTVGRIYAAYLDGKQADGKSTDGAERAWKALASHFEHKSPSMIGQPAVRPYIAERSQVVKASTVATDLRYLRAALNWAVREGLIDSYRPFQIPRGTAVRKRWLTRAEFAKLIAATDSLALRVFMEIAVNTGSRPEKVYALKWSDVDVHTRTIHFGEGVGNKRTRPLPINDRLAWVLGCAYTMRLGEYVVESNQGERVLSLRKIFDRTRDRAGVEPCVLRDLRSTCASWLVQDGASMEEVAMMLSDDVKVIQRHYAHLSPTHLRGIVGRLG